MSSGWHFCVSLCLGVAVNWVWVVFHPVHLALPDSGFDTELLEQVKELEVRGVSAAEAGDLPAALRLLGQAIQILPGRASAYNNRAQALRLQGNTAGTQAKQSTALSICADRAEAHDSRLKPCLSDALVLGRPWLVSASCFLQTHGLQRIRLNTKVHMSSSQLILMLQPIWLFFLRLWILFGFRVAVLVSHSHSREITVSITASILNIFSGASPSVSRAAELQSLSCDCFPLARNLVTCVTSAEEVLLSSAFVCLWVGSVWNVLPLI